MVRVKKIVIFDSGVGGLSVYKEIYDLLPQVQYIYAFDNAAFPYGELPDDVLIERTNYIVSTLVEQYQADLVVIACNTASTIVLPTLRKHLTIPVVGVVPAIKPAAKLSQTKVIGLLATPATVKRSYTQQLISQFASDCEVKMIGSTRLVEMAEQKLRGEAISLDELSDILAPWQQQVDSIILGCTHFPLIKDEIQAVLNNDVYIVDSGKAIANRVASLLELTDEEGKCRNTQIENATYSSAATQSVTALNKSLKAMHLGTIQSLQYPYS
ncbi:glutamate racemase [Photobacterium leiognathi]|uniref:glutamate racemase n=1 Tax=Photobacterium leiognathi TaxID=553611 RepID=UPI000D16FBC4|nr:glutamate racemase [Photobacterium leiognathi]PSW55869.1 glutamate racemase [Photobacterium leiognathi subsp. mandapamensis]